MSTREPYRDPVREAFNRYYQRFPIMGEAMMQDPETSALLKQMERMLVAADCAMQDEGLTHEARRRVISTALYGGPDEERAAERLRTHEETLEMIKQHAAKVVVPGWMVGMPKDEADAARLRMSGFEPLPGYPPYPDS